MKKSYKFSTYLSIWISVTVLVLSSALSLGISHYSTKAIQENVRMIAGDIAQHMAYKMDEFMWSYSRKLALLSAMPSMKTLENSFEIERQLNALKSSFPYFAWIGVTDSNGVVIASTDGVLRNDDISDKPVFKSGIQGLFIGDVHEDVRLLSQLPNPSEAPMKFVDISIPLTDDTGQTLGVLAAQLNWGWAHDMQNTVMTRRNKSSGIEMFVVSTSDQTVLLGPDNRIGTPFILDRPGYIEEMAIADGYLDYRGLDWRIYVRQPEALAYQSVRELQTMILIITLVLAAFFILLSRLISNFVSKPLAALASALDRVRSGEAVGLPRSQSIREVNMLSDTLYELFDKLQLNKKTIGELEIVAHTDSLTGLANRAGFDSYLSQVSGHNAHFYVFSIDLDGFKHINDIYGHAAGDFVLREIAGRLKSMVKDHEMAARIGGDEFMILRFPRDLNIDAVEHFAERIIKRVNRPIGYKDFSLVVGCSVGVSIWRVPMSFDEAFALSDLALYESKANGKNRYTLKLSPIEKDSS